VKGSDGSPGNTGAQGPRGPQGVRGAQGPPGQNGAQGPRGQQGLIGPAGQDCANILRQCEFKAERGGVVQRYDRYVYVYAKARPVRNIVLYNILSSQFNFRRMRIFPSSM
jgi:hypothetical protein